MDLCPGCGTDLGRVVKRQATCAHCGARILRPRPPLDPARPLLTIAQVGEARAAMFNRRRAETIAEGITSGFYVSASISKVGHACPVCMADHERSIPLEEIAISSPLPHAGCTCTTHDGTEGVCRCFWLLDDPPELSPEEEDRANRQLRALLRALLDAPPAPDGGTELASHEDLVDLARTFDHWWPRAQRPPEMLEIIQRYGRDADQAS